MIEINFDKKTFTCPFCRKEQGYMENINMSEEVVYYDKGGYRRIIGSMPKDRTTELTDVMITHIQCSNMSCGKILIVGRFLKENKQFDILSRYVHKSYPDYIPKQIRDDYTEASDIIDLSPKAAATLFRRCLQGMIHDFWNIHEKNLNAEISKLKDKVSLPLWSAIDGLRKMGNIGAHMEHDVNLIVDIDTLEAQKLQKLIELLFDKWYIARHDEEKLLNDISDTSDKKQAERVR
jgi:gp7